MSPWQNFFRSAAARSPLVDAKHRFLRRIVVLVAAGISMSIFLSFPCAAASRDPNAVDAAIVLAVDTSSSIDPTKADSQRQGHAAALRSREVRAAIEGGATGCIAITYVEWASVGELNTVLPWTKLCNESDLDAAADTILGRGDNGLERRGRGRTSLSFAIDISAFLLERWPGHANRWIIDLSSNGTNNDGPPVAQSRQAALGRGYIINAIAVSRSEPGITNDLPGYYRQEVIGGPGSFVIAPAGIEDYVVAMRRKLVLEIAGLTPGFIDCASGENPVLVMPISANTKASCME